MKRIFVLSLAILLMLAAGCSDQQAAQPKQTTDILTGETVDLTTEEEILLPDLPNVTYDGEEFIFTTRGESYNEWKSKDIGAVEQNGEPINDAVYERNLYIEEKYKIKIVENGSTDPANESKKAIMAGDKITDVIMADIANTVVHLSPDGYIIDLYDLPHLDLTKPWWDARSVEQLSIGNRLLFMTGDLSVMANDATWILMFNKSMIESLGLEIPYLLVKSDKWTYDKMHEMMVAAAADLNGDGEIKHTDDRFGLATHDSSFEGFFFASGSHTVAKDEDDLPYLDMNTPRLMSVIEKTNKLMGEDALTVNSNKLGLASHLLDLQPIFETGRSLFFGEVMQCIIRLRTMEIDFGVLPFPKLDETQEKYNHFIHSTACVVSVPITNTDLERTGVILEAITAKSRYTLQPAYYEVSLDGKFMRDEESADMLDIIVSTRNYDIGYIHNWGGLFTAFKDCVKDNSTDFASKYAAAETSALTQMEKTVTNWLKND